MRCCNQEMKIDKITPWNEALVHCNKCGRADHYPMKKETMKIYLKPGQSFKFDNGFEVEVEEAKNYTLTGEQVESISKLTNALHEIARYKEHKALNSWSILSHTTPGKSYNVRRYISHWECDCPDWAYRGTATNGHQCKHIREKLYTITLSNALLRDDLATVTQIAKEALGLK